MRWWQPGWGVAAQLIIIKIKNLQNDNKITKYGYKNKKYDNKNNNNDIKNNKNDFKNKKYDYKNNNINKN